VRGTPGEAHESVFQSGNAGGLLKGGERVTSEEAPGIDNRDAIGEELDFRQSVRGEEQGSIAAAENLGFQETPEFGSGDGVQTSRRLI